MEEERKVSYYSSDEEEDDYGKQLRARSGIIHFPQDKLYGRDAELAKFHEIYSGLCQTDEPESSKGVLEELSPSSSARIVFLGGYSGTGKSALVEEFVRQIQSDDTKAELSLLSGKFDPLTSAGDPFSAISHALNQYVIDLVQTRSDAELAQIRKQLARADIFGGSDAAAILTETLVPVLPLIVKNADAGNGCGHGLNVIKFAFISFVKVLASTTGTGSAKTSPVLAMFLDDLQWADDTSLQLLSGLLKDKSLKNVMFIGAYRANEVGEDHELSKVMAEVEEATTETLVAEKQETKKPENPAEDEGASEPSPKDDEVESAEVRCSTTRMEIFNLSPASVAEFIADSVDMSPEKANMVAEAVYTKTLGNVFFVKQALEELVRKHALYYDMVIFAWECGDLTRVDLERCLSDDVIEMVQGKLRSLPNLLQKALAVASFTRNSIDLDVLTALLQSVLPMKVFTEEQAAPESAIDNPTDSQALHDLMNQAFVQGIVLHGDQVAGKDSQSFKFAHDRIREAASASVPTGHTKHLFLRAIAMALLDYAASSQGINTDWMLFAAARHLNSLPSKMTDMLGMAELNLRVGKVAYGKGAFSDAVVFLRTGVKRLDTDSKPWTNHYRLCLDLKNHLVEAEHFIGNENVALEVAEEIFTNGKSLADKSRAQIVFLEATNAQNNNNYEESAKKGLEILKLYGVRVPTDPSDKQVKREKFRFRLAQRGRSLHTLADFPIATDETFTAQMKVAEMVLVYANFGKKTNLTAVLGHRMLRLAFAKKNISKDLPSLVVTLGGPLRQEEKYEGAFAFANASIALMDRFPEEKGRNFVRAKMNLYGSLGSLRLPFREAIDKQLDLSKQLLSKGETIESLASGMIAMLGFLNASLPLTALFEPKLLLFQQSASNLGRKTFVVIFSLIRQCLYNLQGGIKASPKPAELKGAAFIESEVQYLFEGAAWKMNNRDIGMIRLLLAVIFNDEDAMVQMLERLDEYPVFDMSIERQHLRMSFMGLAAFIMSQQTTHEKHELFAKWAKTSLEFFRKLATFGSPNAQPVYCCLKALDKPSVASFDEAIDVCLDANLLHLAALMNERCGLMLMPKRASICGSGGLITASRNGQHEDYLRNAAWLYGDWGAAAKVEKLTCRFGFLYGAKRDKEPSQLSAIKREAAMLGVPRGAELYQ